MGTFGNCTMGNGDLWINDVPVGFLKGDVEYSHEYSIEEFKTGVPSMLRGSITKEVTATLKAPLAELTAENLAIALGGLTPAETPGSLVDKTATFESLTFVDDTTGGPMQRIKLGPTTARDLAVTISGEADAPVIKDATEALLYIEDTDYVVDYDSGYVYRLPGGDIGEDDIVKVKYKYTPPASKQINLGVVFALADVKVEFRHTRPQDGKLVTVIMWKANADGKASLKFAEGSWNINEVTFKAVYDATHPDNPLGTINCEV